MNTKTYLICATVLIFLGTAMNRWLVQNNDSSTRSYQSGYTTGVGGIGGGVSGGHK